MTEEVSQAAPTQAVIPQAEAPVVSPTVEASAVQSTPTSPVNAPAAAPVVAKEAPPVVEAPKTDAKTDAVKSTSLLGAELVKTAESIKKDKPAEVKTDAKPAEPNKQDGGQSDKTAQSPSYEAFKLPDGVTFDEKKLGEFTKELSELQATTKAEKAIMQAFGQKLIDRHVAELQAVVNSVHEQTKAAEQSKIDGWKAELEKASDKETALSSAGKAVSLLPDAMQKDFHQFLDSTGVGNNAVLVRTLAHYEKIISDMNKKYNSESGVKPLVPSVPIEKPKGMANKMYGSMGK
jgi:hypothetical protein